MGKSGAHFIPEPCSHDSVEDKIKSASIYMVYLEGQRLLSEACEIALGEISCSSIVCSIRCSYDHM